MAGIANNKLKMTIKIKWFKFFNLKKNLYKKKITNTEKFGVM